MWKTGHSLIKNKMAESDCKLGGEMSGHIFFADDYFGYDDAIYVAARLIQMLSKIDKTLSELKSVIPIYHSTPEIRLEAESDEEKFIIAKLAVEYFTENDLRAGTVEGKTPDFLLMKPIEWHGDEYNWIESKASFGDEYIHRKNHRGQVSDYVELYGQGILVYWYGYLDVLKTRGYTIVDRKELGIE